MAGIGEPTGNSCRSSPGRLCRPPPGHADPADDPHHEQDLGPGGPGHAHGHLPLLLHRPGERSVRGGWGDGWAAAVGGVLA